MDGERAMLRIAQDIAGSEREHNVSCRGTLIVECDYGLEGHYLVVGFESSLARKPANHDCLT